MGIGMATQLGHNSFYEGKNRKIKKWITIMIEVLGGEGLEKRRKRETEGNRENAGRLELMAYVLRVISFDLRLTSRMERDWRRIFFCC